MEKFIKIFSFIFSLAALCISAYAVSGKCCGNIENTALTIVGICTTLIVGISVVDAFAFHSTVSKMEKRMNELAESQKDFEEKRDEQNKAIARQKDIGEISNNISWGLALLNWLPYTSLRYFTKGLEKSLEVNNVKAINSCIKCMENVPKVMVRLKENVINDVAKEKGCPQISEDIKKLDSYKIVKDRVEKVFDEMKHYYPM